MPDKQQDWQQGRADEGTMPDEASRQLFAEAAELRNAAESVNLASIAVETTRRSRARLRAR